MLVFCQWSASADTSHVQIFQADGDVVAQWLIHQCQMGDSWKYGEKQKTQIDLKHHDYYYLLLLID